MIFIIISINQFFILNNLNNLKMKLGKLFLLVLALFAFGMTSCGDDEDDNDCTRCTLNIPLLDDCEIDVCPDGTTTTVSGGINCTGGEAALAATGGTQQENIDALTTAGFSCN